MIKMWVTQLDTKEAGYISLHKTEAGALNKLIEFARREGIAVDDWDPEDGVSEALDLHPHVNSYGVYNVPVED